MKHALSAAVALALGLGLAAAAEARGTYDRHSAIPGTDMQAGASGPSRHAAAPRHQQPRKQVMQTQRMLQARGFYHGKIDGMMNRQTRMAMARFQHQKGPHRMVAAHKAHRPATAVGVGTSRPADRNAMSGSSSNITPSPTIPPATQTPNAGGSDQNR